MRVALGTYVPGDSVLHSADPRTKIVASFLFAVTLFFVVGWPILFGALLLVVVGFAIARVPFKTALTIMQPILFISVFTMIFNSFSLAGGLHFSFQGFMRGVFFVARIISVMGITSIVTLTTPAVTLADGFAKLARPLAYFKVPVEDIALMLSIGLRFIPTIAEELDRIVLAQKMRGAQFDEGSLLTRVKAWIPVLIPLFIGMFRRADVLALAMEARCYTGQNRTHLNELKMKRLDIVVLVFITILCAAIIAVPRLVG